MIRFHERFVAAAAELAASERRIHDEEVVYNIVRRRHPELFAERHFDLWWHEDNIGGHFDDAERPAAWLRRYRPFYRVLEDLRAAGLNDSFRPVG
ncbi:MAG: hypothetical protein R2708_05190 [Vicinamibacterales bacterium]